MEKFVMVTEVLDGYNGRYNHLPADDTKEISEKEYFDLFFAYSWRHHDTKQIYNEAGIYTAAHVFIKSDFNGKAVGIMVTANRKFYQFGDWAAYSIAFVNQFRGDRS